MSLPMSERLKLTHSDFADFFKMKKSGILTAELEVIVAPWFRLPSKNPWKFLTSAWLRLGWTTWWWTWFEADEFVVVVVDDDDDGTNADAATLACGIEVCRIRCSMKDSAVVLTVEEEEVSVDVFSSDVDSGPIDEMCELQGKSICKKKVRNWKEEIILGNR